MQKTQNLSALDMLSAVNGVTVGRGRKTQNGFKDLLDGALQGTKMTQPEKAIRTKQQKPAQGASDNQPADAALASAAAAGSVEQPVAQEAEAVASTQEQGGATVIPPVMQATHAVQTVQVAQTVPTVPGQTPQTTAVAAEALAQATATLPEQPQGGDILSMDLVQAAADTEAASPQSQLPGQVVATPENQNQDRFGAMLNQAQQQLQQINDPAQAAQDETPVQTDPALTAEEGRPFPVENVEIPAEDVEGEAADEAPAIEDEQAPIAETRTRTQGQTETRPADQRTLREMPETDRAMLELRETRGTQQRRQAEPTQAEQLSSSQQSQQAQPQQTQNAQQTQQAQAPQQDQQNLNRADQSEQIRQQVEQSLESGRTEFRMQLQPEELGKISIKMVIDGGRLAVEIMASGTRTAELLSRQVETLGHTLRAHTGMEVTSINVVTEPSSASGSMYSPFGNSTQAESGAFQGGAQGGRANHPGQNRDGTLSPESAEEEQTAPETLLNYTV